MYYPCAKILPKLCAGKFFNLKSHTHQKSRLSKFNLLFSFVFFIVRMFTFSSSSCGFINLTNRLLPLNKFISEIINISKGTLKGK